MDKATIPVIELHQLHGAEMLARLDEACREWGFFYLTGHDLAEERVLHAMQAFFSQPVEEKRKIKRSRNNPWGFFDEELTKNRLDWKEIFDYGPADGEQLVPRWPGGMPEFQQTIEDYYTGCEQLCFLLLSAISRNLGLARSSLDGQFQPDHTSFVRLNYYPVCDQPESPAGLDVPTGGYQGINHHTDSGAITILMQSDLAGLEVYRRNTWHLIEPRNNTLIVNIGDIVQVWSNDRYSAALHRVRANSRNERYSAPFFFNPSYKTNYAPVVDDGSGPIYRPINWGEFRAARADGDFHDTGEEIQISRFRIQ